MKIPRVALLLCIGALCAACAETAVAPGAADSALADKGHKIAEAKCARCHGVDPGAKSRVAEAPPFSSFARMWPVDSLEAHISEGIEVGHLKYTMPVVKLDKDEIAALVAYLETIQAQPSTSGD